MRKVKFPGLIAVALLTGVLPLLAGEGHSHPGKEQTVQGEVLDLACYLGHQAKGPDHAACARKCVQMGQPMGLLAGDGTVYLLTADHQKAGPFNEAKALAGTMVEIRGVVSEQGGIKGITVLGVKSLG